MAVVVEPIVTYEKLLALLAEQCEQSALDYKQSWNLGKGNARDVIELARHVAAMQSEADGGYIVVGADDHGAVVPDLTDDLVRHFDDATLRRKLSKYLTEPDIRVARHIVNGQNVALIYIPPSADSWCIFREAGEYEEMVNGKSQKVTVFRVGDVFVRHGSRSERWNDSDRRRLTDRVVARRKDEWRREQVAEFAAQAHLGATVQDIQGLPSSAVTWRLDIEAFDALITELIRREDDIPLRRLLTQTIRDAESLLGTDADELARLADRLTGFAALNIHYDRPVWTRRVVETLVRIYELGAARPDVPGFDRPADCGVQLWFEIVTRVYSLGALAVRQQAWPTVKLLADRRPDGEEFAYYGSWLRHAVTAASRAHIFDTETRAELLARAHNVVRTLPSLHPDCPAERDAVLNSLCQFDVLGALVVIGERGKVASANYYPNFARYRTGRSMPAFELLVTEADIRGHLFDGSDQLLADAIREVSRTAGTQAFAFDGWEGFGPGPVIDFIEAHGSPRP